MSIMVNSITRAGLVAARPQSHASLRRLLLVVALLLATSLVAVGRADAGSLYYTFQDSEKIGRAPITGANANHAYMTAGTWAGDFKVGAIGISGSYLSAATIGSTAVEGIWQWSPAGYAGFQRTYNLTRPTAIATIGTDLYWAEAGGVDRIGSRVGSTERKAFITTGVTDPGGLAVDANYVYWTNTSEGTIGRAKRDGTDPDPSFISGTGKATGLTVNGTHIFWANENEGAGTTIGRADLDGGNAKSSFISGANAPHEVAVDATYLYWTNAGGSSIGRAKLDGSEVNQSFITTPAPPLDLAIDADRRSMSATLDCMPAAPMTYRPQTCTVTVKDVDAGTKEAPSGAVRFGSSNTSAGYFANDQCTLANPTVDSASCTVTYTPSMAGDVRLFAMFEGAGDVGPARAEMSQTVGQSAPAGATTTDFECTPTAATVESAVVCTFTVTDTRTQDFEPPVNGLYTPTIVGASALPSGSQRTFVPSKPNSPSSADCQLTPISERASQCVVYYYPPAEGTDKLSARFDGVTGRWLASPTQEVTLTVGARQPAATTTSVSCAPERPVAGTPTTCTVLVEDNDYRFSRYPLGVVEVIDASDGKIAPSGRMCALNPLSPGSLEDERGARSTCRITYTPERSGTSQLGLEYVGDGMIHAASTAQLTLEVDPAPASEEPPPVKQLPISLPAAIVPPIVKPPAAAPSGKLALRKLTALQRRSLARHGRVTLTVTVPAAGRLTGTAQARTGKRLVRAGSFRFNAGKAGTRSVRLKLSSTARKGLRRTGRLWVSVEVRMGGERKSIRFKLTRPKARTKASSAEKSAKKKSTSSKKTSR